MATFLTLDEAARYLASKTRSEYAEAHDSAFVLFTSPPPLGTVDGSDGVEVAGYTRPILDFGVPAPGSPGRTAQSKPVTSIMIDGMPVASTEVHGFGFANASTGEVWVVNDSWTPSTPFEVGGMLIVQPDEIDVFVAPGPSA